MSPAGTHPPASWLASGLGVRMTVAPAGPWGQKYAGAVEVGLRVNPNRAQLFVSRILGKHVPVPAGVVLAAGHALGAQVRHLCAGSTPVVVGFAETATALGHAVAAVSAADGGLSPYLHTTRRAVPPDASVVEFREEHSHATEQKLALFKGSRPVGDAPLVIVDDELTTGRTALNAIRALQARWPRRHYVLASLLDSRSAADRLAVCKEVAAFGAEVTSAALLAGVVVLPADLLDRAAAARAALPDSAGSVAPAVGRTAVHLRGVRLDMPTSATYGWSRAHEDRLQGTVQALAAALPVHRDRRTLVLGDEEFMYFGQLLAMALGDQVHTSATTRSPAVACDVPGYPLRTVLRFPATGDPDREAFAYNVAASAQMDKGNAPGFDDIVFVTDTDLTARNSQVLGLLSACARRSVQAVQVSGAPGGSDAGRYAGREHTREGQC